MSTEFQKIKFSLRDILGGAVFIVVWTGTIILYLEHRFTTLETHGARQDQIIESHDRAILENQARSEAGFTSMYMVLAKRDEKLDKISDALGVVAERVGEISGQLKAR